MSPFRALLLLLPPLLLFIAGCSTLEIASRIAGPSTRIDGQSSEWGDSLSLIEGKGISVGFSNDDTYLNLILMTSDRALQRRIMGRGITLWFDAAGGTDRKFGVHFPIGRGGAPGARTGEEKMEEAQPDMNPPEQEDSRPGEVVIFFSEKDPHRMTLAEASGIEIRVRPQKELLVYEMRIPLRESGPHPFAIGMKNGGVVGVGIDGSMERPQRPVDADMRGGGQQGREPYGDPSGDPYGDPGRDPAGRGMRQPGGGQRFEATARDQAALNIWMKVKLAGR